MPSRPGRTGLLAHPQSLQFSDLRISQIGQLTNRRCPLLDSIPVMAVQEAAHFIQFRHLLLRLRLNTELIPAVQSSVW